MTSADLADICYTNNELEFRDFWMHCSNHSSVINRIFNTNRMTNTPGSYINYNTNCLCIASQFSDSSFVKVLLENGARTDVVIQNQDNPLHKACSSLRQPVEKVKLLLLYDHSLVTKRNQRGHYPLHFAVLNKNPEVVSVLLSNAFCDINVFSQKIYTPLHVATKYEVVNAVQLLLSRRDLNVNAQDVYGNTVMHYAAAAGYLQLCAMIKRHPNYNQYISNGYGMSAKQESHRLLIRKAATGTKDDVQFLVEECGVPCIETGCYTTPFHEAVSSKIDSFEKLEYLRSFGSNP